MKKHLHKAKSYAMAHKILSFIIVIVILLGAYIAYGKITNTSGYSRYVTAKVERGAIISSVSGTGQVSTSNSIDLKAKSSGTITYVGAKAGDFVSRGKTIFSLDARTANKAVRDAETALETAKLDLEKFVKGPNAVDILTLQSAITDAGQSKTDAEKNVKDTYRALLNSSTVAVPYDSSNNSIPPTITGTYIKDQEAVLDISVIQSGVGSYFNVNSTPPGVVSGSGNITTATPSPIGDSGLYIKFASSQPSQTDWFIYLPNKTVASYATNLTAYKKALDDREKAIRNADLTVAQNQQKIKDLNTPDSLDLQTKQLAVKQKEDALKDAQDTLSDYYVTAPFDGIIASVTGKFGDIASGTLATLITNQKIAEISMNEVDVAKIKIEEKTTLTFDAIPDLSITGEVAEIDTVGTVSQGVVTYNVKISFDTQDTRVKPGMSVSASVVADMK